MAQYEIHAYDQDHNELWITTGTAHLNASACRRTDNARYLTNWYELIRTGLIIDPETGKPVIRRRNPKTGKFSQGSRYIAYFRTYDNGEISEIYFTRHGRKAGVRNYQARRPTDGPSVKITGRKPIYTEPRIVNTGHSYTLVVGEGDPNGIQLCGNRNVDQWGDPVVHIATCSRVTMAESDGGWWGYTYANHCTSDHCPLEYATVTEVRRHLTEIAKEMIDNYGADITRW